MPAALPGSAGIKNDPVNTYPANPSAGQAVLMDALSGPKGSPLDKDNTGNCTTGAMSTGIGYGLNLVVAPGKLVEFCGALRLGQSVTWSFEAEGAVDFNIHYHVGEDVRYPSRMDQVRQSNGVLAVESAQDYCWMWANKSGQPSKLAVALNKK